MLKRFKEKTGCPVIVNTSGVGMILLGEATVDRLYRFRAGIRADLKDLVVVFLGHRITSPVEYKNPLIQSQMPPERPE